MRDPDRDRNCVAIVQSEATDYPSEAPFSPSASAEYPELERFAGLGRAADGRVYSAVRQALLELRLDEANRGRAEWNPFRDLIVPGNKVVIKPNLVLHHHRRGETVLSIIVHASILRPILDYVQIALRGEGEIVLGDAPVADADFEEVMRISQVRELVDAVNGHYAVPVRLVDFRKMVVTGFERNNIVLGRRYQPYGAEHSTIVNLGRESALYELDQRQSRFYGADFDRRVTCSHHNKETQRYSVASDVLEADVVIGVPKLKTHKSAGVTLNVKNLVGINTDKNYLPHHRIGEPREGGDEFPDSSDAWVRTKSRLARAALDLTLGGPAAEVFARPLDFVLGAYRRATTAARPPTQTTETADLFYERVVGRTIRSGHWWGNDTLWRVGADLMRAAIYADKTGTLHSRPQRRFFSVMDGIIAGEGKGPMIPIPRRAGVILAGEHPVAVDYVATCLMGFDPSCIPIVERLIERGTVPLDPSAITLRSNVERWRRMPDSTSSLHFRPAPGWVGHTERTASAFGASSSP